MVIEKLSQEELKSLSNYIANEILTRISQSLAASEKAVVSPRPMPYACTGTGFKCGDYSCTGTVSCSGQFDCTIKFMG
jgi:hypothetical protein